MPRDYTIQDYRQRKMASGGDGAPPAATAPPAPSAAAVAVKSPNGRGSQRAVRWAIANLIPKLDRLFLVHVMPTVTSIPTPSGESIPINELEENLVKMYVRDTRKKCQQSFIPFKILLERGKVEIVVLQGINPAFTLLRYLSDSGIKTLVLGSCSSSCFKRRPKGTGAPSTVLKHAPETCDIYVVSTKGLMTNSLHPLESESLTFGKQQSRVSTSSIESKVYNSTGGSSVSDFSLSTSQTFSARFSDVQEGKGCTLSSTYSKQAEAEQIRQELQNTITMYRRACRDLIHAQKKFELLSSECLEEAEKVNAAKKREENLRKLASEEQEKNLEAEKEVWVAKKQLAKEAYERQIADLKALKESLEKQKVVDALLSSDSRYQMYTRDEIEEATEFFSSSKIIGEGAYGKVYKSSLYHTPVAIKVVRPDASDKKEEFLREVEVLSQLHHPHILLLLGACPQSGCLVYEYMENGNLEDHLFLRNNRPPLPWCVRFQIAFEVASGLAFLHSSKPEPIVHRDLKPGNILIDGNYVSKIGDVGLAKIISDVVPENVTEYRNSILAGTLAYMDPEYQRTGTLRPKSDLYAFGVVILQLLVASRPNGIISKVEEAISSNSFADVLDKSVKDWPLAEAEELAEMALKCCKLRCRDRPDLETEVLPNLKKLAEFADASVKASKSINIPPGHYYCPILQELMEDAYIAADGFTYEHRAIKTWLERHDVSPVTKVRLQHKMLTPNHTLRMAIQAWRSQVSSSRT